MENDSIPTQQEKKPSLFSKICRKVGLTKTADFLDDKDKVCTDGKDDGKLSFKDGAKSFLKGLVGGIPKAIVNHPIATAATLAVGIGLTVATGGAAAPILWAAGTALAVGTIGVNGYKYLKADTDSEAKSALEGMGTGTGAVALSAATYSSSMKAAESAGVNTKEGFFNTLKNSGEVSLKNMKANYTYLKSGIITQGSNALKEGVEVSYQGDGKPVNAYKINIDQNLSVEQNLSNNPGIKYANGKYYVETSWGEPSYIDPDSPKGYMFVEYGPNDTNAVEGIEFAETYVDHAKFAADGTKSYVDPSELKGGTSIKVTKQAPGAFKIVPEGTEYVGAEGPATVQPKSVLRIDSQGRPYQSTVDFMFKKFQNLTPDQIAMLKSVDPEAAAKYGY